MACRFAFFALFVFSAVSCSNDSSSQETQEPKSTKLSQAPAWEYKAQPNQGAVFSSWTDIPQTDNQLRLAYMCFYDEEKALTFLFLQFAASPSLVTTPVKGNHFAKSHFAWGDWNDLAAMVSAPTDSVYLMLEDQSKDLFSIRARPRSQEADQRLQSKLWLGYGVLGIALSFYEEGFRIRNEAVFIDVAGAPAALAKLRLLSPLCSSAILPKIQSQILEEINRSQTEIQKGQKELQKELNKMIEDLRSTKDTTKKE